MHLLHQRVEVRELLLVADLRDELHFDLATIEVAGPVEHMRLEQRLGAVHRGAEPEACNPRARAPFVHAARRVSSRAESSLHFMSAIFAWVIWKVPIGWPKALRSRDHCSVAS